MTLEELQARLAAPETNIAEAARATGMHYNTAYRISRGWTMPAYDTAYKLQEYFRKLDAAK